MEQNNKPFGQENNHIGRGKMRAQSPRSKPMVLSRRTSYKIANGSPRGHSPVVAMELNFDKILDSPLPAQKKFKSSGSAKPRSR